MSSESKSNFELIESLQDRFKLKDCKRAELIAINFDYSTVQQNQEYYDIFLTFIEKYLNEVSEKSNISLFLSCQKILCVVSEKFDVETVILDLVHHIPEAEDDLTFLSLLKPFQKALLLLPPLRNKFLLWSLHSIQKYIEKIEVSDDNIHVLTDEEKLLMDSDPYVDRITHLLFDLLPFYDPLIEHYVDEKLKTILGIFLLKLLGEPLVFFDLTSSNSKGRARRIAESIIEKYVKIQADIYSLLEVDYLKQHDLKIDKLAVASLFYLTLVEHVSIKDIPKVYNKFYVFYYSMALPVVLLSKVKQLTTQYGLDLAEYLLSSVEDLELPSYLLDSSIHTEFCKMISKVIVYNHSKNNRKLALKLLTNYLYRFGKNGRYLLLNNLVGYVKHAGLVGYLITEYKKMLIEEIDSGDNISEYFTGSKLKSILQKFCYLPKQEMSDLVDLSDQIIASLNLIRYLLIRDKNNVTKIWNNIVTLEKYYFEPLKNGLILSRADYQLKIKEVNEGKTVEDSDKVIITVGNLTYPPMPNTEKIKVLHCSLTAFDMIESILIRVQEIINCRNFNDI